MRITTNDAGEQVIAAGQPGSIVWVRTMYPAAIRLVNLERDYDSGSELARNLVPDYWPVIMKLSKHCTI